MIITKPKDTQDVLASLESEKSVFIVGCGTCSTSWATGGEPEVQKMKAALEEAGKNVVGWMVIEQPCDERKTKKDLRGRREEMDSADAILVMSCGAGVQTISMNVVKPTYPALDTIGLARIERLTKADERCLLCGDCVIANTGGLCPVATCAKGLLNGACGGSQGGKCEVDPTADCGWIMIYEKLKATDRLEKLDQLQKPKDHKSEVHPRRVDKSKVPAGVA